MAILELTKENLVALKFDSEDIYQLLHWDNYDKHYCNSIFASNIENKIYTEKDYYIRTYNENSNPIFPFYCLDLIGSYFDCCLNKYLKERKTLLGSSFIEQAEIKIFTQNEIQQAESVVNYYLDKFKNRPHILENHPTLLGKKAYKIWLENKPPQQTETKTPTAIAIALFCNLINDVEIIKRENDEIPEKYCKRICEIYSLKYTDRVRQNFNGNKSKKHYKELTELILPCIDVPTKDKIQKHLDSKNPPKQKLYA